jgi:hypothetical protein
VPNLARKPEFPYDVMRDGKCLAKLHSVYSRLGLLIENRICIVVKSVDVRAGKRRNELRGLPKSISGAPPS